MGAPVEGVGLARAGEQLLPKTAAAARKDTGFLGTGIRRKPLSGAYSATLATLAGSIGIAYNAINLNGKLRNKSHCKRAIDEKALAWVEDYGKAAAASQAIIAGTLALAASSVHPKPHECSKA